MPQPLKTLVSGPQRVNFGSATVLQHPTLAAMALEVIGAASIAETNLARLVATFTHGRSKPVLDYYLSLKNEAPKAAVIEALARSILSAARLELFRAILKLHQIAIGPRNPIAHWIWAECDGMDALLLVDPRDMLETTSGLDANVSAMSEAYHKKDWDGVREAASIADAIQREAVGEYAMVYRESDFKNIVRDIRRSHELTMEFHVVHQADILQETRGDEKAALLAQQPELRTLIEAQRRSQTEPPKGTP